MESSVSARMASNRYAPDGPAPSTLQRYILQACSPENFEPNLALNLEIADLINLKKGNAPREAAVAIVNNVNHRNPNVALLALNLLDICVKNCGYPFHLQISTKEFLNELVRRFPERPPIRASRVQMKILEAIEEWRSTICLTSRYKEDLGFIRDMHRLLSYKGYMFPEVRRDDAAVLNPSDNLRSADEMEEEERAAQSAKLQELIRRGGPSDLQEANRLMKIMAGYDTRNKTDYRAKAAEEVSRIQQKARLLEERLAEFKPGDKMEDGDVYEELASALQSAHPKIQKMCEEESEDHEAVAKLLEINDSIHRTVERYKLMKKGDIEAAARIEKGTLGTSTGVSRNADNELSLIDFDAGSDTAATSGNDIAVPSTSSSIPTKVPGGLDDDLLGLDLGGSTGSSQFGQGGGISLGFGSNSAMSRAPLLVPQPSSKDTSTISPSTTPTAFKPNYSNLSSLASAQSMKPAFPQPSSLQSQTTPSNQFSAPVPQTVSKPVDPFAALTSPLRKSTPQPPTSATKSMFDFANPVQPKSAASTDDDEWNFSSATLPEADTILITNTSVRVDLKPSRSSASDPTINLETTFSNNSSNPISELTFQVAVTKGYTLKMEPQSGRRLQPNEQQGIRQIIHLNGVAYGNGQNVKMRWKLSYKVGAEQKNEEGMVPALGIS